MKIELRIRNLKTREVGVVAFETDAEAFLWLKARPAMLEVMGMAGQSSVPQEVQDRLRAAMRPLDADEQIAEKEMKLAADAEDLERAKAAQVKEAALAQKHKEDMATADPERLMEIHWRFNKGMALTDAHDPRPITDAAQEAVLAWIAERNEWVAGRGQCVGECTVKVWPGKMPAGQSERVKEGRFFPVSAEEKN
ncbi:MAG TPA: hypothetical protein VIF09_14175 [Polyangiaceae bacterium]